MLLRAIGKKIEGRATEAVIALEANLVWDEIKDAPLRQCREKGEEDTLMIELYNLPQEQSSAKRLDLSRQRRPNRLYLSIVPNCFS